MQYLIAFCSRLEATCDVISGANVRQVGMDVHVLINLVIPAQTVLEIYDSEPSETAFSTVFAARRS